MLGQETRDLGAMIVQQEYKYSFMILYGHSRLDSRLVPHVDKAPLPLRI